MKNLKDRKEERTANSNLNRKLVFIALSTGKIIKKKQGQSTALSLQPKHLPNLPFENPRIQRL